jgi:DNA-binding MarR family transcriptional regulator
VSNKDSNQSQVSKDLLKLIHATGVHDISISHLKAARNIKRRRELVLAHYDLRSPAWFVLGIVASHKKNGVTAKELAQILEVKSTYITAIVGKLKNRKLIYTEKDATDSRFRQIYLTDAGAEFCVQVEKELASEIAYFLEGVTFEEVKGYVKILRLIAERPIDR